MDTVSKLECISKKLDRLSQLGQWVAENLAEQDPTMIEGGVLISRISEDVREKLLDLVVELETQLEILKFQHVTPLGACH